MNITIQSYEQESIAMHAGGQAGEESVGSFADASVNRALKVRE
jgi:hypothetical protein